MSIYKNIYSMCVNIAHDEYCSMAGNVKNMYMNVYSYAFLSCFVHTRDGVTAHSMAGNVNSSTYFCMTKMHIFGCAYVFTHLCHMKIHR